MRSAARCRLLVTLSLVVALAACAKNPAPDDAPPAGNDSATRSAAVRVTNRNFYDMNLFVVRFGQRLRLGTVTGNSTRTFELPAAWVTSGPVRFLAAPIGSTGREFTEELTVQPGDVVGLTIQP
jgi:hypothetical protein